VESIIGVARAVGVSQIGRAVARAIATVRECGPAVAMTPFDPCSRRPTHGLLAFIAAVAIRAADAVALI
jgi:hypothetical protein